MQKLEQLLEWGGTKRDIAFLILSGLALLLSIFHLNPFPFDMAWVAIILCGVPIILEAVIGLVTAFDIKADVLVSIALIASVLIGEDFAAGEVAFMSNDPNWLTVPLETASPTPLSTGSDSPVMTAWLIEVCPERMTPSTGTVSPGSTRRMSPACTCSAGRICSCPA